MKKSRTKKNEKKIDIACSLLFQIIKQHPEFETTLWAEALMDACMTKHISMGSSYERFCEILDNETKEKYKSCLNR